MQEFSPEEKKQFLRTLILKSGNHYRRRPNVILVNFCSFRYLVFYPESGWINIEKPLRKNGLMERFLLNWIAQHRKRPQITKTLTALS